MATIRLVPSEIYNGASGYVSISNTSNAYYNTDHTSSYATIQNTYTSTSSRYVYVRGFNFDDIPSGATINSFTIKVRGYESGLATSSSYAPTLANGTSALSNTTASENFGTSTKVITVPNGAVTWANITSYGSDFGIRLNARRNNRNTTSYIYLQGAEIEVDYTAAISYTVTATSNVTGVDVTPASQSVLEGDSAEITIDTNDISNYVLTDNNVDVTSSVVYHQDSGGSHTDDNVLGEYTLVSGSFNGSGASYFQGLVGKGHTASTTTSNYYSGGSGTIAVFTYDVSFNNIPDNATIQSCYAMVNGHAESTSNSSEYMCAQIRSGNTQLSSELNFKSVGTSNSTQTITCTTIPTIAQLENLQLYCRLGYYGGAINGATVYVEYSTPAGYYYTYTITNVMATHTVVLDEVSGPYIPDPEDPQKTYYSLTLSSINATTSIDGDVVTGTVRVEEGSDETITITPSDPQLTLALDNGVDITSQLVSYMPTNTYTVTTQKTGANYGFPLNNSTGYYTSNNNGVSNSAAVCRVNFDFETACLVTISYINYAEATYDYGIFSQVDSALGTTYSADNGAYHTCSASSDNTSNVQTLTYTIPAGTHYIEIKYRKDQATNSNNDELRWQIASIEPTTGAGHYTYTLNDIDRKHSLIFIFGDVTYYFITSTIAGDGRAFPDGQQVVLPGDGYRLNIIPDNYQATVTLTDNGVNVTSQLDAETGQDKQGNTITSYKYSLSNIQAAHNLIISIGGASIKLYVKINGSWVQFSKVYRKINGSWVEQDITNVFNTSTNYRKG